MVLKLMILEAPRVPSQEALAEVPWAFLIVLALPIRSLLGFGQPHLNCINQNRFPKGKAYWAEIDFQRYEKNLDNCVMLFRSK